MRTSTTSISILLVRRRQSCMGWNATYRAVSSWSSNEFNFTSGYSGYTETEKPANGQSSSTLLSSKLTPRSLKSHLDRFVVGQDRPKRVLSSAIYHHYRRIQSIRQRHEEEEARQRELEKAQYIPPSAVGEDATIIPPPPPPPPSSTWSKDDELMPVYDNSPLTVDKSNILCLGPTGVGKTLMIKTLARVIRVPFSMSDCTPFTQAGYVGEDVEVCVHRLLAAANWDVRKAESGIICLDEFDKLAKPKTSNGSKDISGEGVQQALLKLIEGTTVTIQAKPDNRPKAPLSPNVFNPSASGPSPSGKGETFTVDTSNILFIFTGAFTGLQKMIMDRVAKGSIGFTAPVGSSELTDPKILQAYRPYYIPEDTGVSASTTSAASSFSFTHNAPHNTSIPTSPLPNKIMKPKLNALELTEPADLVSYGLIPEIIGRIPVITAVEPLTVDMLMQVLTEPANSLVAQYKYLLSLSGVELSFTTPALREIAKTAEAMGTGARGLRAVVERLLHDVMFETPGSSVKYVLVTEKAAKKEAAPGYYSRGEVHLYKNTMEQEEEEWRKTNGVATGGYEDGRGQVKAVGFA